MGENMVREKKLQFVVINITPWGFSDVLAKKILFVNMLRNVLASGSWRCFQIKLHVNIFLGVHYGLNVLTSCMHFNKWLIDTPCCMLTGVQGNMIVWWVVFTELHSLSEKSQLEMQNLPNAFDKFMLQCVNYKQDLFAIWKPSVYCTAPSGKTGTEYTFCL